MYTPIRWQQRLQNFEKAFNRLSSAIERFKGSPDDELILEGLVQTYEFTYELAINTTRDFLEENGETDMTGTRTVIKQAIKLGIIKDAHTWMDAIADRNKTSHTYDEKIAQDVVKNICERYFFIIRELYEFFKQERDAGSEI